MVAHYQPHRRGQEAGVEAVTPLFLAVAIIAPGRHFDITVYSERLFDGKKTAYGETYRHWGQGMTCATRDYPYNTILRITWKGRTISARVTDKIHKRYKGKRIDLNGTAWKELSNNMEPGRLTKALVIKESNTE